MRGQNNAGGGIERAHQPPTACTGALAGTVMSQFKTNMSAGRLINSIMDGGFGWRVHGKG